MRTFLTACALAILASGAFLWRLDDSPVYLSPDEAIIAVDAHSIATTGHDVRGRRLPLYFQIQMPGEERAGWFMPAIMYLSALFQKALPLSERVARMPSVVIGVADVVLLYLVGRRLFRSEPLAILLSVLLLITPAHFLLSRYALDYEYPLPFILGWLLCLMGYLDERRDGALLASVACLGVGFYSYISAVFMVPLYFAITLLVLARNQAPRSVFVRAGAVFSVLLLPFLGWLLLHPAAIVETAGHYGVYDTEHLNPLQGLRSFVAYQNLDARASLYWSFFDPGFLFFSGDQLITFSTRRAGVFLLPMAAPIVLGIVEVLRPPRTTQGLIVLAGFVTAPLAAVLATTEHSAVIRATALIPFGLLLSGYGFRYLMKVEGFSVSSRTLAVTGTGLLAFGALYAVYLRLTQHRMSISAAGLALAGFVLVMASRAGRPVRAARWFAGALLLAMAVQFGVFWTDYFGGYRLRSAPWLSGNLSGALTALIDVDRRTPAPHVYFTVLRSHAGLMDTRNRWMDAYWRFYAAMYGREELLERSTQAFEIIDAPKTPAGSLFLSYVDDRDVMRLVGNHTLEVVQVVPELDREPFFAVLRK
jgi:4-amino-4-deoxy-L-arabinose transferase-like glycosyltransferase